MKRPIKASRGLEVVGGEELQVEWEEEGELEVEEEEGSAVTM